MPFERTAVFEDFAAHTTFSINMLGEGAPERVHLGEELAGGDPGCALELGRVQLGKDQRAVPLQQARRAAGGSSEEGGASGGARRARSAPAGAPDQDGR